MKIKFLKSTGVHSSEIKGIKILEEKLPASWIAYASLEFIDRRQGNREIDLVLLTDDRIILVDLKDWNGELTYSGDFWYLNGVKRERSPVIKLNDNAKILSEHIDRTVGAKLKARYWIDSCVVLTGSANSNKLSGKEIDSVIHINDFIGISNKIKFNKLFPKELFRTQPSPYSKESIFDSYFYLEKYFKPKEAIYGNNYSIEGKSIFKHPDLIYTEYKAERKDNKKYKALLRIWDLNKFPIDYATQEARKAIVLREINVLGYIKDIKPEFDEESLYLRPITSEASSEITDHYYELYDLPQNKKRLQEFVNYSADRLKAHDRINLVKILLSHVANLHDIKVAHRDLGDHSVWLELPTKVTLSGFITAAFPDTKTVGELRSLLRAGGVKLPEDELDDPNTDYYRRDVFLLGACAYPRDF